MNARMDAAGYTTSGRNAKGKSSAIKKAKKAPAKVAKAKVAKKVAPKKSLADSMPKTMNVPGSARPSKEMAAPFIKSVLSKSSAPKSMPKTGRDRWGAGARPDKTRFAERQANEAKIMSDMYRNRLGPGQR